VKAVPPATPPGPRDRADTAPGRTAATVSTADADATTADDRRLVVPALLAQRLGVEDGDSVVVTTATGTRATASVRRSDGAGLEGHETVSLPSSFADRVGVTDGDRVVLERATPRPATEVVLAPLAALSVTGAHDAVADALGERPVLVGETVRVSLLEGSLEVPFRLLETDPAGVVLLDAGTTITIESGPAGAVDTERGPVPSTAVGGYESTVAACRSALVRPLVDADAYTVSGASAATGVVVEGQPGVGKSHHVRHAAWLADATRVGVDATRLTGGADASVEYLQEVRTRAVSHPRALVHVEGLDAVASDGSQGAGPPLERLGDWIGRLVQQPGVVVAAETRDATALPDSLTRGDRLGRRLEVPRPTSADRAAVFATLVRGFDLGPGVDPETVAERALGYTAADLVALRARLVEAALDQTAETDTAAGSPTLTAADLETALATTTPSATSAAVVDVPDVSFDDVGGLTAAKRELVRAVEWPLRHPDALERLGIEVPGGVLLYGPPGTGKTLLARAVASSTDANFLAVDGPELFDKFVGESERAVREVFKRARESAPAVVFFDEVDALGATRGDNRGAAPERVVSQLLTELDGLENREGVTVLGATNRPDRIDPALLRPGRFDRTVEVGLPDRSAREEILRIHARDRPLSGVDLSSLAGRTEGYSGSDLAALLREASLAALQDRLDADRDLTPDAVTELTVEPGHVELALEQVSPSARRPGPESPPDSDREHE
jgi:transitional endoplasmic reticulum ATPase